jgi:3-hydroxybutyryl-CoA dehydrogenase
MDTLGIAGAGTMGRGIAHVAALTGLEVLLYDLTGEIARQSRHLISTELQKGVERGNVSPTLAEEALGRIEACSSLDGFGACRWVIEAVAEDLPAKKEMFTRLETVCTPGAILATNTSSLPVSAIAGAVKSPERVIGLHFFNPPHRMKLVEVVLGTRTSAGTLEAGLRFVERLGKHAVVAKDTPGFIVNRLARPFYGEALRLLGEGVATVEEIDRIVKLEGGFKMGPFELMDLIGIDVNLAVTKSMYDQTFGEPRYRPHVIQQMMVSGGRLGRKTGRGFYEYDA